MNIIENKRKKNIGDIYDSLSVEAQQSLMDFAEFLSLRESDKEPVLQQKQALQRPDEESVVAALKRLNQTYPMIERKLIFHDASSLMTEHIMQGREAAVVIDDLEALFERQYQSYLQGFDQES